MAVCRSGSGKMSLRCLLPRAPGLAAGTTADPIASPPSGAGMRIYSRAGR